MPEYSGSLQSFETAALLWLAPLLPLAAAVYALLAGRPLARGPSEPRRLPDLASVGLRAGLATLALVAGYGVLLVLAPAGRRQLISHAWNLVRVGSVDANFTLTLDPTTALLTLGVCGAETLALAYVRGHVSDVEERRRLVVAASTGLSGLVFLLLGDDWFLMLLGAGLSAVAAFGMGRGALSAFALARVGDAALLGAGALLLWGLGGTWTGAGDFVPDFRARLVGVQLGEAPVKDKAASPETLAREGSGQLSMAVLPGARLSIGGADLCRYDADGKPGGVGTIGRECREVARSPFARLPLPAAVHDVQVSAGPGTNELVVQWLKASAEHETLLAVTGGTLSPREIRDQLELHDATGAHPLRAELSTKKALGLPLLVLVALLLGIAAAFRGLLSPLSRVLRAPAESSLLAAALLAAGTDSFVGVALLARGDFLLLLAPKVAAGLAFLAALAGLYAVARAAHTRDPRRVLVGVAAGQLALGALGLASGAHAGATVGLLIATLGVSVVGLSIAKVAAGSDEAELEALAGRGARFPTLARASQAATLALSGAPLPLVGSFWPRDAALQAAGASDALGPLAGWASFGVGALLSGLVSFAAWRLHQLVFVSTATSAAEASDDAVLEKALLAAAVLGLVLGVATLPSLHLGDGPAHFEHWLGARDTTLGAPLDKSVRLALLAVGFAAALAGWAAARARYGSARSTEWVQHESARVAHAWLSAEPRAWFDALVVRPAFAAGRWLDGLDDSLDVASFGPLPDEPEPVTVEPPADEAPPAAPKKRAKKRARKKAE